MVCFAQASCNRANYKGTYVTFCGESKQFIESLTGQHNCQSARIKVVYLGLESHYVRVGYTLPKIPKKGETVAQYVHDFLMVRVISSGE